MAKKDRTYKIEVVMTGNPPKRELQLKGHNGPLVFNKSHDAMRKVDHYRIRFALDNPSQTNLRFIQDMADVMWVHPDLSKCPDSPCSMPGVIWVDKIDSDGKWIDVINMDLVVQDFRFTLNLADKAIECPAQADYVPLDPIGENQNRGIAGSGSFFDLLFTLGAALLAGQVALMTAEPLLPRW